MSEIQPGLVSVIVPVYNVGEPAVDAVRSALDQDHPSLEVIVVDDGSTDDTPARIEKHFGDRVRLIRQANAGPPAARNRGIAESRGEFVALLDADDLWFQGRIRRHVETLAAHPDVGMVYSDWREWRPRADGSYPPVEEVLHDPSPPVSAGSGSGWLYTDLLMECVIHTSAVTMRRSLIDEVGELDSGFPRSDDYDYWLRVSRHTRILKVPEVLSVYRIPPRLDSYRAPTVNWEDRVVSRALERWGRTGPDGRTAGYWQLRRRRARSWRGHAYSSRTTGRIAAARSSAWRALVLDPACPAAWWELLRSLTTPVRPGSRPPGDG